LENTLPDLENRVIRIIHDQSFNDDPTRIMRAVRFEQRLHYVMDETTLCLLQECLQEGGLGRISVERIRNEIELSFKEKEPLRFLNRLQELHILDAVFPGLVIPQQMADELATFELEYHVWRKKLHLHSFYQFSYIALLADLNDEDQLQFARHYKLKWLGQVMRDMQHYRDHTSKYVQNVTQLSKLWKYFHNYQTESLFLLLCREQEPVLKEKLERFLSLDQRAHPFLKGEDLNKLGIPSGRTLGFIMQRLFYAKLDGQIRTRDDEIRLATKLWNKKKK
jgi:tRNA nucleotidyltransferase (CCA-adding enzyme)